MKIDISRLLIPALVAKATDEPIDPGEVVSRIALSRLLPGDLTSWIRQRTAAQAFAHMCRGAVIYLLDAHDWSGAIGSTGIDPQPGLPPLPFGRIAIETSSEGLVGLSSKPGGETTFTLAACSIAESPSGWFVMMYGFDGEPKPDGELCLQFYVLRPNGDALGFFPKDGISVNVTPETFFDHIEVRPLDDENAVGFRKITTETIHLITARGVQVIGHNPDRAERRRFQRQYGQEPPKLYLVKIGGETVVRGGGAGIRVYRHRWMVRGHWRHYEDGRRTWIKAYIKGPAGAPWKGRPIYVTENAA